MNYPSEERMLSSIFAGIAHDLGLDFTRDANDDLFVNDDTQVKFECFLMGYQFRVEFMGSDSGKHH